MGRPDRWGAAGPIDERPDELSRRRRCDTMAWTHEHRAHPRHGGVLSGLHGRSDRCPRLHAHAPISHDGRHHAGGPPPERTQWAPTQQALGHTDRGQPRRDAQMDRAARLPWVDPTVAVGDQTVDRSVERPDRRPHGRPLAEREHPRDVRQVQWPPRDRPLSHRTRADADRSCDHMLLLQCGIDPTDGQLVGVRRRDLVRGPPPLRCRSDRLLDRPPLRIGRLVGEPPVRRHELRSVDGPRHPGRTAAARARPPHRESGRRRRPPGAGPRGARGAPHLHLPSRSRRRC